MAIPIESADDGQALVAGEPADGVTGRRDASTFERLLGELSTTFIRITAAKIDSEIEEGLGRVVRVMGFDRGVIGQVNPADGMLYVTHQWARAGVNRLPDRLDLAKVLPWLTSKILADEMVVLPRVRESPPEAEQDREFARTAGALSHVTVPLKIGGVIKGGVAFGTVFAEQTWPDRTIQRLRLVAEIFGNALERKRAVEETRQVEEEIRQLSRLSVMGELTVSLAHELNQPLGAIRNNAQAARRMLAADQLDLAEIGAALDDIVRDNSRAVEIIKQVRALFQRGDTQKAPVDLRQVLREVESLLRHDAMLKGISLRLVMPEALPGLFGQRTQLMQLLINLVLNAFDALSEIEGPKREIEIWANYDGAGRINVAVRDSGPGIDPKDLPRLFDAFFTTKEKGIGLGLSIARSIAENHGGRLWAVPNTDRGAILQFELPVAVDMPHGFDAS